MNYKVGFIGSGNMGSVLIRGIISSHLIDPKQIIAFDTHTKKLKELQQKNHIEKANSEQEVAEKADIVFLAVKPGVMKEVLEKIKEKVTSSTIIVSIAAGITLSFIENILGKDHKIVRVMPNIPTLVNEGMSAITANAATDPKERAEVATFFAQLGQVEEVPESLIHAVIGASGSSPAFIFMLIEAMADGAVLAGMPREKAYKFAAQATLGAAKMVLEVGKHPADLKDMVCSPAGTTIEGVKILEERNFRAAVIEAVVACANKSKLLSAEQA